MQSGSKSGARFNFTINGLRSGAKFPGVDYVIKANAVGGHLYRFSGTTFWPAVYGE